MSVCESENDGHFCDLPAGHRFAHQSLTDTGDLIAGWWDTPKEAP